MPDKTDRLVDHVFGSREDFSRILTDGIRQKRESLGMTHEMLDRLCELGNGLPGSCVFEGQPHRLRREAFCRASFLLDLQADQLLRDYLDKMDVDFVVGHMRRNRAGLISAARPKSAQPVALSEQARVYAVLKALEEMDKSNQE